MEYFVSRYDLAASLLPPRIRAAALSLDDESKASAEEFRLRVGRRPSVLLADGERSLDIAPATRDEVAETVSRAARGSIHSVADELAGGFITAPGGHRLGVCGRAVVEGGECRTIRDFSSVDLRIAKEVRGAADGVVDAVCGGGVRSTIIISPPGGGKTTLLRDLVRQVGNAGIRVTVADERGEIAALGGDGAGFDVGECTDVLTGAPKAYAALTLLRAMDPQAVALDEITDPADFDAVRRIAGCGVAVFATMHASDIDDACRRAGVRELIGLFERVVVIERIGGRRTVTVRDLSDRS